MDQKATTKQRQYLRDLKVPEEVLQGMTMAQADKTIRARENAKKRKQRQLEGNNQAASRTHQTSPKAEHQEHAPMPKPVTYVYDKLCTRKVDNVPALVKELVTEMELAKGHNVFTTDAIRDAIRNEISRLRESRTKKAPKRKREDL